MKVLSKRPTLVTIALSGGVLGLLLAYGATSSPAHRAEVVSQPDIAVELSQPEVLTDIVAKSSRLRYTITNRASGSLDGLRIVVVVFDSKNEVRALQRATQEIRLPPGQSKNVELQLSNMLFVPHTTPAKFVLAVEAGRMEAQSWEQSISTPNLIQAMRTRSPLLAASNPVSLQSGECPKGFCNQCKSDAKEVCSAGVKTYSCNPVSCDCSFECFPPIE